MSTENTATDSLELAKDAINYVLQRIQRDENIRYHMGAFTEAFERLKKAHCALNGISEEALEADIFGRELKYKPKAKMIDEIRDLLDDLECGQEMQMEIPAKIKAIIRC